MTPLRRFTRPCCARLWLDGLEERTVPSADLAPEFLAGHEVAVLSPLPEPGEFPREPDSRGPFDPAQTFKLHSRPTASHVIYLDFNGHTTTGTFWNDPSKPSFTTPAFDVDGNPAAFSALELDRIQFIWQRVMEDYSPFDVDVTTEFPGLERLRNTGAGDSQWGIRAVIGGDGSWYRPVGGVAFVGSFDWDTDTGCFIFSRNLGGGNEKFVAEAASHEIGHTLGLSHDGRISPAENYYRGHGSGETGWAPILGVGYYQSLTHFSRGEYLSANQPQDDLAIITSGNGFGYRPDDHGDIADTATPADLPTANTLRAAGVIERRTDVDVFSFTTGAGAVSFTARPFDRGPNVDIGLELFDATGTLVASANPPDGLSAAIHATVPAGRYFLRLDGVGKGDALGTGYSDYGSLGQYTITGNILPPDPLNVIGVIVAESSAGLVTHFRVAFNVPPDPRTFRAGNVRVTGPTGLAVPILGFRPVDPARTIYDLRIVPQRLDGPGGVRVSVGAAVASTGSQFLDQDGDGGGGEINDYFAAAAFRFDSAAPGRIADPGTTDFPLVIDRALTIRDLNVRVHLTHPYLGDLEVQLVSPTGKVVPLFQHRGVDGNDLQDTHFDDSATARIDTALPPFAGIFRPDGGSLADLTGDEALGTWTLRVLDLYSGAAGQVNSWGMTLLTDDARGGVPRPTVTAINEIASTVVTRVSGFEIAFDRPMNPVTITPTDLRVTGPGGLTIPVRAVVPVAGTDNTRYLVDTAAWARAGTYTVRLRPTVADVAGNGLDPNQNGAFLEPSDEVLTQHTIANHVFASRHRPMSIPRGRTTTSVIDVANPVRMGGVAVELNLQHPAVGDVRITLIAPTGQRFVLVDHRGGSGSDFVRTVLADAAGTGVGDPTAAAPFRGDFRPEESLFGLAGRSAAGTWRLRIEDSGTGDPARLLSWALYITPGEFGA